MLVYCNFLYLCVLISNVTVQWKAESKGFFLLPGGLSRHRVICSEISGRVHFAGGWLHRAWWGTREAICCLKAVNMTIVAQQQVGQLRRCTWWLDKFSWQNGWQVEMHQNKRVILDTGLLSRNVFTNRLQLVLFTKLESWTTNESLDSNTV